MLVWKTKPASLNSIFPEIYQRWIYKRNFLHRPLCRRYWPQTNPADTNPHNVFRYLFQFLYLQTTFIRFNFLIILNFQSLIDLVRKKDID